MQEPAMRHIADIGLDGTQLDLDRGRAVDHATGIVSAECALLVAARAITPQAVDSLAVEVWSWWDCAQGVQMTILSTSSRLIWSVRRS